MSLSGVDYLVIAAYLVAITAFGSWFGRFQKTTRDYFLTGRMRPLSISPAIRAVVDRTLVNEARS